jgi:hypothetical protein
MRRTRPTFPSKVAPGFPEGNRPYRCSTTGPDPIGLEPIMSIFSRSSSDGQPTTFDPKTTKQIQAAYAKEARPAAQRNGVGAVAKPAPPSGR